MNTQHIIQLLQQALQELQQQPAQAPAQPAAVAVHTQPAPPTATAPAVEESRWVEAEVGTHNGNVFDPVKTTNRGENMTGFFMKLEQGGCFVKAFGQDCDTLIAAGAGARFKAYLNIQPAPGKRNPYRNVSQVQLIEKVVQF